jgi:hypothetical protein
LKKNRPNEKNKIEARRIMITSLKRFMSKRGRRGEERRGEARVFFREEEISDGAVSE